MGVYTENIVENQARKEKVYDMMRKGDWQAVCKEFHVSHQIHKNPKLSRKQGMWQAVCIEYY